jgi:hypothetical protein
MLERSAVLEGGATLQQRVAALRAAGDLNLPLPGKGKTALRHLALRRWGHQDLSLARIAEAHTDASAILAEAGRRGSRSALYGVWASDGPAGRLSAERIGTGR